MRGEPQNFHRECLPACYTQNASFSRERGGDRSVSLTVTSPSRENGNNTRGLPAHLSHKNERGR